MALAPDSIFVRSASRHAITEAGVGNLIDQFGRLIAAVERGELREETVRFLGRVKRPEFDDPVEAVDQAVPPGHDPNLPRGGRRFWAFDATSHLPVLIVTLDHTEHQVEYYCYDRIQFPVKLDDADFDPDKLWPVNK
jgi:hypothetical protein